LWQPSAAVVKLNMSTTHRMRSWQIGQMASSGIGLE